MSDRELKKAQRFFQKRNYAQAEPLCLTLLEVDPQNVDALQLLAQIMSETSRHMDAIAVLEAGLSLNPYHSMFHSTMGKILNELGRREEANAAYTEALKSDVKNQDALLWLGGYHSERGEWAETVAFLRNFLQNDPDNQEIRQLFCNALQFFVIPLFQENYKSILTQSLQDEGVDARHILATWALYCRADPLHSVLQDLEKYKKYPEFVENIDTKSLEKSLQDPFLVRGIEKLNPYSLENEILYTNLRRYFLQLVTDGKGQDVLPFQSFLWALSMQCWANEYAFYITDEEKEQSAKLKENLESGQGEPNALLSQLYLLSCYQSPLSLSNIDKIVGHPSKKRARELFTFAKKQINDHREEERIKPSIKQCTKISDDISKMVQDMYEENPYPRWDSVSTATQNITTEEEIDILSAGCGTGQQSVSYVCQYPNANFLSVDLSLSSLAYAIRQTKDLKIKNLTFEQGDILELDKLERRYDQIFCTGVLHHMDKPEDGLAALKNILKPDGMMLLAFYSELARAPVVGARNFIKEHGYQSDPDGIREFRHDVMLLNQEEDTPDFARDILGSRDFYRLSECRDLVFHVQEHRYTIPQLLEMLDRQGLEFLEFKIGNKDLLSHFQERFPDENDIRDPMKWHEYEQDHPHIFSSMYVFTVRHRAA